MTVSSCGNLVLLLSLTVPVTAIGQAPSSPAPAGSTLTLPVAGGRSVRIEPDAYAALRVSAVTGGSDSASAPGLRAGDLVIGPAKDGRLTLAGLRDLVKGVAEGDSVALEVRRDAETLTVYYRKPTAAELARMGAVSIPGGAARGAGGTWMTLQASPDVAGSDQMLVIAGNQIRLDEESGQLKVMMKLRDPDMAAVGLKALDRILKINRDTVADLASLIAKYGALPAGDSVTLLVERNGAPLALTFLKPAPRP